MNRNAVRYNKLPLAGVGAGEAYFRTGTSALPTHHSSKIYEHFSKSSNSSVQEKTCVISAQRSANTGRSSKSCKGMTVVLYQSSFCGSPPRSHPPCRTAFPATYAHRPQHVEQHPVFRCSELTEGVVRQQLETVLGLAKGLCSCSCEGST
jgi:hypothetical protein